MELLTTAQVAERAQVHPRTVAEWVEKGQLAYTIKLPGLRGAMLFDPTEVSELVAKRED